MIQAPIQIRQLALALTVGIVLLLGLGATGAGAETTFGGLAGSGN